LCDLRDQDENKNAAVAAAKVLEQISDDPRPNATVTTPGVTIRIVNVSSPPAPVDIKAAPRIIDASDAD